MQKGENGEEKKENCKKGCGKVKKNGRTEGYKMRRVLFFFFFFFFKTTKICFGSTKIDISYWEKAFHAGKKIRKYDFAPSEKFYCNAPGGNTLNLVPKIVV